MVPSFFSKLCVQIWVLRGRGIPVLDLQIPLLCLRTRNFARSSSAQEHLLFCTEEESHLLLGDTGDEPVHPRSTLFDWVQTCPPHHLVPCWWRTAQLQKLAHSVPQGQNLATTRRTACPQHLVLHHSLCGTLILR